MPKERKIITDKIVVEKTGKTLEEWFVVLDKKGGAKMNSKEIHSLVGKTKGLEPLSKWNQGLLSTSYQWSRGIRERGEKANGYETGVSKTINVPLEMLYNSWADEKTRKKWLKEKITMRKMTKNKSARITWSDEETSLSIDFYNKETGKSQVVVQHLKIKNSDDAMRLKEYWAKTLDVLKQLLEK
ncbi:MAG: hypothetical protein ACXVNM_05985 [Bacteroidia bacterium]